MLWTCSSWWQGASPDAGQAGAADGRPSNVRLQSKRRGPQEQQATPLPLQVLRLLGRYLEPDDIASARLACSEWHVQLSAQVAAIKLPPTLWQYCAPGQVVSLYRLLSSFRHVQEVRLRTSPAHPLDSWAMSRATDALRLALPTLRRLELGCVMQAGHWRAILVSLQCVAGQLTGLRLADICWPPRDTLHLLGGFTALRSLTCASPHFSRLEGHHLDAIAQLGQLRQLQLAFRTVSGTAAEPLSLDGLSRLVRLTQLDVQYTGLLELSSAVVFCRPTALRALSNLSSLTVSLVPMPSLPALDGLPQLKNFVLQQAQPLSSSQCNALARCQWLQRLSLICVQWGDLAHLAPLTSLTSLAVQVWQPSRGSLPGSAAGQQLLALRQLSRLQHFTLRGQCELPAELLARLAGHWAALTSLDLCCVLPHGTQGLQHFSELRSLKVRPYKWDVWSSEPPVLLFPSLLPPSLTALHALDVWCMAPPPPAALRGAGCIYHSSSYCSITGFLTGMSSVGRELCNLGSNMAAAAAAAAMMGDTAGAGSDDGSSDACSSEGRRRRISDTSTTSSGGSSSDVDEDASCGTGVCSDDVYLDALAGEECSALVALRVSSAPASVSESLAALAATPASALTGCYGGGDGGGAGLVLNTPRLQQLVLRSTSPFDRRLLMPDFSLCSRLETLELHHSQLNQCHVRHIAAACLGSLRALKLVAADDGARIRASGLTILTQLSGLTSLSVHAHERAINRNVRRAIASMAQLRALTLLTSPEQPSLFARHLAGNLTQLTNLVVLRVGLGFGALDALRRLGAHVGKALPHCTYQMLTDGSCD